MPLFERMYQWAMTHAQSRRALWVLALVSFGESAFLPLPVDAVAMPIMLAQPRRIWFIALLATVTSVAGGLLGYAIGFWLYETLGRWLVELYGLQARMAQYQQGFANHGWLIVITGGISPLPYKVVSIASGLSRLSLALFMAASVLSRGIRFAAFAVAFHFLGPSLRRFMDRHRRLVAWAVMILFLGGFATLAFL